MNDKPKPSPKPLGPPRYLDLELLRLIAVLSGGLVATRAAFENLSKSEGSVEQKLAVVASVLRSQEERFDAKFDEILARLHDEAQNG